MAPGSRRKAAVPAINTAVASYQTSQPGSSQASHSGRPRHSSSRSRSSATSAVSSSRQSQSSTYDQDDVDGSDDQVFYVQAMHDFDSTTTEVTCLSFRAGQIIRVFNRHQTGWWDGECNGLRGWFPSNYVNTQISTAPSSRRSSAAYSRRGSRATTSSASASARGSIDETQAYPTQLVSLVQALSLLQNAVRARRITHFQPSTACVISCVRSVLSATDCLGRDSPALIAYPRLAGARKQVLADLARLVTQTRKASEIDDVDHPNVDQEMEEMMRLAETVYQHVRKFLDTAAACGLELPERRAASPALDEPYERYPTPAPSSVRQSIYDENDVTTRGIHHSEQPLGSPTSSNLGAGSRTRSLGDLRVSSEARTPDASTFPSAAAAIAAAYNRSVAEREHQDSSRRPESVRTASVRTASIRAASTVASEDLQSAASSEGSGSEAAYSSDESEGDIPNVWPQGPTPTSVVIGILRITQSQLVSTLAAFIGTVHSHTQNDHASSKGHLIEMTRETVDQVRQLIALVDSVMATSQIAELKARELVGLESSKSTLFACTSSLVDSIRAITSLGPSENEDVEKGLCLTAATGAMRAAQDCATSMKLCLARRMGEEPFMVFVLPPPVTGDASAQTTPMSERPPYAYSQYGDYADEDGNEYGEAVYVESPMSELGTEVPSPYDAAMGDTELPVDEPTVQMATIAEPNDVSAEDVTQRPISPHDSPPARESASTPVAGSFPQSAPNIFVQHVTHEDDVEADGEETEIEHPTETETDGMSDMDSGAESRMDRDSSSSPPTTLASADSLASAAASNQDKEPEPATPLMDKIKHGDLPSVPSTTSSLDVAAPPTSTPNIQTIPSIPIAKKDSDPNAWLLGDDHDPSALSFNDAGTLNGGTLPALVEKMSSHRAPPDQNFARSFMLTFRLFTTPAELLQVIAARFDTQPPTNPQPTTQELRVWQDRKQLPIRMRLLNLLKLWLEGHWHPQSDDEVLPEMLVFAREKVCPAPVVGPQGKRLMEIIEKRRMDKAETSVHRIPRAHSAERLRPNGGVVEPPTPQLDRQTLTKIKKGGATSVNVSEFDVLELARQLTIKEGRLYCAIRPEELLASGQTGVRAADSVRAVTQLSTCITGWVIECLLDEPNTGKRAKLLKFFILLADKCLGLHNFSTLRAVMAALDSSTISRLSKTWAGVSAKYQAILENLRKIVDHSRNHAEYRTRLRTCTPPAVPFLGIYLTDIIFCREGNPATRKSPLNPSVTLLNFHRYSQLARILHDMQRFQRPYNLLEIDEMQRYLDNEFGDLSKGTDIQELYSRSLLVEPRQPNDRYQNNEKSRDLFAWTRSRGFGGGSS